MTPLLATVWSDTHSWFGWVVVFSNAAAGVWALAAHWVEPLRHRSLWVFTAVAQATIILQAVLGTIALSADGVEAPETHLFYGFVSIAAVGIIYSYRAQLQEHRYLLYGGGGLFLMGMAIRSMLLTEVVQTVPVS